MTVKVEVTHLWQDVKDNERFKVTDAIMCLKKRKTGITDEMIDGMITTVRPEKVTCLRCLTAMQELNQALSLQLFEFQVYLEGEKASLEGRVYGVERGIDTLIEQIRDYRVNRRNWSEDQAGGESHL